MLVSIQKQRLRAFDASGEVTQSRISSGRSGFDTPTGVFSVLEKSEYHESNIYEGAPMPFMQRLTWSGIAMHAGVVPGYRASHGCIRLPASFAPTLFGMTRVGNRVVVTPNETEPIVFDHPNLFKPLPAKTPKTTGLRGTSEATQIASNDTGPEALAEMQFLRANPALTEALRDTDAFAPERPRSRAEADRMFMDKVNKLQLSLKAAELQKTKASATAKIAVREADEAQDKLAGTKKALEPARDAIDAADKKLADARRTFEGYMMDKPLAGPASKSTAAKVALRSDEREADLEEAILDLRIEADGARADLARREMDVAANQGVVSAAEAARAAALEDVRQNQEQLRIIQADLVETNKQAVRRGKSISVFVSLKTERIYVRLGQDPLFEAPIEVTNPGKRFGTHVMTAMRYGADPNTFDWRLVSAQLPATVDADDNDDDSSTRKKRRYTSVPVNEDGSVRMARAALDSIKIPQDILDTITELARPGASFIISDRELNASENGTGTEFVLLTR